MTAAEALALVARASDGRVGLDGQGTGTCPTCGKRDKFRFSVGDAGLVVFACHSGACKVREEDSKWIDQTARTLAGRGVPQNALLALAGHQPPPNGLPPHGAVSVADPGPAPGLPSAEAVDAAHDRVLRSPGLLALLHERMGLGLEHVAEAEIGFDAESRRFWLPVLNDAGELLTIIRRDFRPDVPLKSLIWKGSQGSFLYAPFGVRPDKPVIVTAGERDCLALCARGFNAVSFTNGESAAPPPARITALRGRQLVFAYDNDTGNHATRVATALLPHVDAANIVEWPSTVPEGYDVCDILNDPTLGEEAIEKAIADAKAWGAAEAERQREDELYQREMTRLRVGHRARLDFNAEQIEERQARSKRSRSMHGASFFLDIPANPPVLWGQGQDVLWVDGEPLMICGDDGTGKSTIDHQLLACRLGVRDTFLNYCVEPAKGRVVYLAMDRPEQARRAGARLFPRDYRETYREVLKDRLAVWSGPLPVDVLRAPEALADWLQDQFGSDISDVHADSLKDIAARLSDDSVGSGLNSAIQEVVARGINWVGLHHQRKANGENRNPESLSDVFGSRWLTAGQGSVLMLVRPSRDDKDLVEVRQLKEPMNKVSSMLVRHDRANGTTRVVVASKEPEQILHEYGDTGATASEVAAAMYAKPVKEVKDAERKKAERSLNLLVKQGEVTKIAGSRGGSGGSSAARYVLNEEC